MLFQVGGQGARPTFFEMSAAQQLPASLRAALTYSLGVKPPASSPCSCSSPIGSIESLRVCAWFGGLFNRACPRWYGS
jgi:peroxin-12